MTKMRFWAVERVDYIFNYFMTTQKRVVSKGTNKRSYDILIWNNKFGGRWGWSRWVFANCNISFDTFTSEISQNSDLALSTYHSYLRAKSNLAPTYRAVRTYHIHLSAKCENCYNLPYKTTFLVYTDIYIYILYNTI